MSVSLGINQRILELVKHFTNRNAAAFARTIQIGQQRFDRLLKPDKKSGKFPMVKPEIVTVILAQYPLVSEVWLLSGAGSMIKTVVDSLTSVQSLTPSGVPFYHVDFIHEYELIKNKHAESIGYYIDLKSVNHADFWCHVAGRSMEPEIASGDMVAMKEVPDRENGVLNGEMYGIVTKNFCTVRRVVMSKNPGHLLLVPSNKSAENAEQEIPLSTIEQIFQVLGCYKKL